MKVASLIIFAALGWASIVFAQTDAGAYTSSPQSPAMNPLGSSPTGGPKPSNQYEESHTAEEDDSLYRGKTGDTETTLLAARARFISKTLRRERVQEAT